MVLDNDDTTDTAKPEVLAPKATAKPVPINRTRVERGPVLSEELALQTAQQLASQSIGQCVTQLQEMVVAWDGDIALTGSAVKAIYALIELATGGGPKQAKKTGKSSKGKDNAADLKALLTRAKKSNPAPQQEGDE